jgi:serine protease Do
MTNKLYPPVLTIFFVLFAFSSVYSQETLPELVRRVKPTVVAITTYDSTGEPLMTGSGFFVSPGRVVTNLHVVRGAIRADIKTLDGRGASIQ